MMAGSPSGITASTKAFQMVRSPATWRASMPLRRASNQM